MKHIAKFFQITYDYIFGIKCCVVSVKFIFKGQQANKQDKIIRDTVSNCL